MKKQILATALLLALVLTLAACGGKEKPDNTATTDKTETVTDTSKEEETTEPEAESEDTKEDASATSETSADVSFDSFYGVWVMATEEKYDAIDFCEEVSKKGFSAKVLLSSEWKNLNTEPYYCVTAGECKTEEEANKLLEDVKTAGYPDAYVKESGPRLCYRVFVTAPSLDIYDFSDDKVLIKDVRVVDAANDENEREMTLVVDKNTVFDANMGTQYLQNYESGDLVYDWMKRNYDRIQADHDDDNLALFGIFDVSLTNDHVDKMYGSYWWD
ncbi:MAG: SPOR domain-containing protein [Lachnospiraceae bacterium]|nr:SPOR domain-containing protein [Lachnospiraceae bacterium]